MRLSYNRTILILSFAALMIAVTFTPAMAAVNQIVWKKSYADTSVNQHITTDRNGNLIIVGMMKDGSNFIRKLSGGGRVLWNRQVQRLGNGTSVRDVAVDASGYIYVIGHIYVIGEAWSNETMPAQSLKLLPSASYVSKYGPKGGHHWTREFSKGTVAGVDIGPGGNIYVVGSVHGTLPNMPRSSPNLNAFIRKYNPAGKIFWTRQFSLNDYRDGTLAIDVAVGPGGGVYVVGRDNSRVDKSDAVYLRKYSPRGGIHWTRRIRSRVMWDGPSGVAADRAGEVTITMSQAEQYAGAVKYTRYGKRLWTRVWRNHRAEDVAVDSDRNIYIVGYKSNDKVYARMYLPNGFLVWTRYFANGIATSVAADSADNLYVTGLKYGDNPESFLAKFKGPTGQCRSNTLSALCW